MNFISNTPPCTCRFSLHFFFFFFNALGDCLAGFYCNWGSSRADETLCPAGFFCPRATPVPLPCPPGTFSTKAGNTHQDNCTSCTPGYYCKGCAFCKVLYIFFLPHMTRITIWWFLFSENNKVKPTIGIVYRHPPLHKVTPNKSEVLHTAKLNRGRHSCSWQPTRSKVSFSHGCEIIQLYLFKVTMLKKLLGTFFFSLVPTHMSC